MASNFGGKPWSLVHHVCLKSAVERIVPDQVFLYYEFEPSGPWWELSRELITPVKIEAPRVIFGRPLAHVAHRSDVVRLQKLIEHGGIYLDADVFVHRNFDDLLHYQTVLGREGTNAESGLANAVILAEPRSPFLSRWLEEYSSFQGGAPGTEFWNYHSVKLPVALARSYPQEITILPHTAFFWPLWSEEHLDWIFASNKPIPIEKAYANHLWENFAWRYLEDLTPSQVRSVDTNFHFWARPLINGLPNNLGSPTLFKRLKKGGKKSLRKVQSLKLRAKHRLNTLRGRIERPLMSESAFRRRIFQAIYKNRLWGGDGDSKYFSGVSSRGNVAKLYADRMAELLRAHAAKLGRPITIVDLGCGDFEVGRALTTQVPDSIYVGCDIVPELIAHNTVNYASERISFRTIDIVTDPLPEGDIYLMRQVLQHLCNAEIKSALKRLSRKHIYITEAHPKERIGKVNPDKVTSADIRFDWRTGRGRGVELDQSPYNLKTREIFRTPAKNEVLITELVLRADLTSVPSASG
jgi:SAM-dependent methyltransferase